jgi:hypothetical protein
MADSAEPKKETGRIALPPQPTATPAEVVPPAKRDTVRINPPTRPPVSPSATPAQSAPKPEAAAPRPSATTTGSNAAAAMPLSITSPADASSPKKETAPITVLPDPLARPGVQMKKTQPLIDVPAAIAPESPVTVAPAPQVRMAIDQIPKPLCWALLGVSAATLIIQIWSYFS